MKLLKGLKDNIENYSDFFFMFFLSFMVIHTAVAKINDIESQRLNSEEKGMDLKKGVCPFLSKFLVFFLVIQGMLLFQMSRPDTPGFNNTPLEKAAVLLSFFGPAPARATTPTARAGDDQTVLKDQIGSAVVLLDGSQSFDSDNDPLDFQWYGPFETISGETPEVDIPEGVYTVSLAVTDGASRSLTDTTILTVSSCFNIAARCKSGKVQLTWSPFEGTERYDVFRTDESDPFNFVRIAETTTTYATYLDVDRPK